MDIPDLSPNGLERLTITGQLTIVDQAVHGDSVHLMGSSMGGYLAALYASRHPEVQSLVLMAPAFDFPRRWLASLGPEKAAAWRETGFLEMADYRTGTAARTGYCLIEDAGQYPQFPDFSQPALIFHGIQDETVEFESSTHFAATHPNARLQLMEAGHELTEVTQEMGNLVVPFLSGASLAHMVD